MSEVGEVAKALLQTSNYGRSPLGSSPALSDELGDAFYSLITLAESLNIDLEAALDGALAKYEARLALQGHPGSTRSPESLLDKE
jgi:NTP pyrophosphatase (non-canonical NTP hydrolase)